MTGSGTVAEPALDGRRVVLMGTAEGELLEATEAAFTEILAAAVIASVPLVVAFLVLQRNFVKGISLTGLGGR